ncbi:unnamed protein product [Euphydryas editha]|uniref:Uncharacterized protein n=1 Tax=Euphydryas editha TaxID=104508 RepID=A0AAU9UN36_EUPED|nr:unnamed protein product [Euphydryas editha]
MASVPDSPTSSSASDDTPSSPPGPEPINKFNWMKHAKNARNNPFVKARPTLNRESSTAELFSRENSSSDFFQNSRLNLFDAAPKPEATQGYGKVNSYKYALLNNFILLSYLPKYPRGFTLVDFLYLSHDIWLPLYFYMT